MLHLGLIWYHSEPLDVPYSQNCSRPISWFGLFLQQNDSRCWIEGFVTNIEKDKETDFQTCYIVTIGYRTLQMFM